MNLFAKSIRLLTVTLWDIAAICGIRQFALVVPNTGVVYKNGEEGSCEEEKECGNCGGECGCDK